MINIQFWYIFYGVILVAIGLLGVFAPKEVQGIYKDVSAKNGIMRTYAIAGVFLSTLMWYGATQSNGIGATVILILSYLVMVKALTIFFIPDWYKKTFLKRVEKAKPAFIRALGVLEFAIGVASILFMALYI